MTAKLSLVADKHKVSDHALTEILAASSIDQGMQLDDSAIFIMSTNGKRQEARTSAGSTIETNQRSIISDENFFVLQWDGKMLNGLLHTDKRKEHIAMSLKPLESSNTKLLLSVTELPDNGTAENETEGITEQLTKLYIDQQNSWFLLRLTSN